MAHPGTRAFAMAGTRPEPSHVTAGICPHAAPALKGCCATWLRHGHAACHGTRAGRGSGGLQSTGRHTEWGRRRHPQTDRAPFRSTPARSNLPRALQGQPVVPMGNRIAPVPGPRLERRAASAQPQVNHRRAQPSASVERVSRRCTRQRAPGSMSSREYSWSSWPHLLHPPRVPKAQRSAFTTDLSCLVGMAPGRG
jgi:hypothetical protein